MCLSFDTSPSFLINISSESLIEYVSQTDLKLPAFAVI